MKSNRKVIGLLKRLRNFMQDMGSKFFFTNASEYVIALDVAIGDLETMLGLPILFNHDPSKYAFTTGYADALPPRDTGTKCHECDGDDYYLVENALECVYCGTQHARDKIRSGVSVRIHQIGSRCWPVRIPKSKQTLGLCKFAGCNGVVHNRRWLTEDYAINGVRHVQQTGRVIDHCDKGHVIEYKA